MQSLIPHYLVIAGVIGVGKTWLASQLGKNFGVDDVYKESVKDNPYLKKFYGEKGGKKKYGFHLEIYLLNQRVKQQREIVKKLKEGKDVIQDRSLYEDIIFCLVLKQMGALTQLDLDTYMTNFKLLVTGLRKPDLIVWLKATPEICFKRVTERNLKLEKNGIPIEYLTRLHKAYESYLPTICKEWKIPLLSILYDKFVKLETIANKIREKWRI